MIIRVNNNTLDTIPVFDRNSVILHLYTDMSFSDIESFFSGDTIEFLSEEDNETVTNRFWIRGIAAMYLRSQTPREIEVVLDVSTVGDDAVEAIRDDADDISMALLEVNDSLLALEERFNGFVERFSNWDTVQSMVSHVIVLEQKMENALDRIHNIEYGNSQNGGIIND